MCDSGRVWVPSQRWWAWTNPFLQVRRGVDRKTGEQVALKEMFLNEDKTLPTHVERELTVLQKMDSPFVLPLRGVISKVGKLMVCLVLFWLSSPFCRA